MKLTEAERKKAKALIGLNKFNLSNEVKEILFKAHGKLVGHPIETIDYILANSNEVSSARRSWIELFDIIQEDMVNVIEEECPGLLRLLLFLKGKSSSYFSESMPIPFYLFMCIDKDLNTEVRMGREVLSFPKHRDSVITLYLESLTLTFPSNFVVDPLMERKVVSPIGLKLKVDLPSKQMCINMCEWFIENHSLLREYDEISFGSIKSLPLSAMFLRYKGFHVGIAGLKFFNKYTTSMAANVGQTVTKVLDYFSTIPDKWMKDLGIKYIPVEKDFKTLTLYYDITKRSGIEKLIKDMQFVKDLWVEIGDMYKHHSTRPDIFNILFGGTYPENKEGWEKIYEQFSEIMKYKLLNNEEDEI